MCVCVCMCVRMEIDIHIVIGIVSNTEHNLTTITRPIKILGTGRQNHFKNVLYTVPVYRYHVPRDV